MIFGLFTWLLFGLVLANTDPNSTAESPCLLMWLHHLGEQVDSNWLMFRSGLARANLKSSCWIYLLPQMAMLPGQISRFKWATDWLSHLGPVETPCYHILSSDVFCQSADWWSIGRVCGGLGWLAFQHYLSLAVGGTEKYAGGTAYMLPTHCIPVSKGCHNLYDST